LKGHLNVGAIAYPEMDQLDLTGPFEVFSRIPDCTFYVLWKNTIPVRDMHGWLITPDTVFGAGPRLDVLLVPGGHGQEMLMDDQEVLGFIQEEARHGAYVFSVCTGALLCGAAGLLQGVRATTHWSAFHLLGYFGAIPVGGRVVIDGKRVSTAGVTAGIEGALRVAALVRDEQTAQQIQLSIEYDPHPPFTGGTPATAPEDLVEAARVATREITFLRHRTARRFASSFGMMRF
jgi:cyclohexyl-isocyanide hydratase